MSHLPFTILAYFLNSVSVTTDKFLLSKHIPDPLIYIFYFSVVSMVTLLLLPFTPPPTIMAFILASSSTLLWTTAAYFMFKALQVGQVSRVIPIIGTLIPLILLTESFVLKAVSYNEVWAVAILILGIVFLTFVDWKGKITKREIFYIVTSAILYALSYILLRQAYLQSSFLSIFVWSRIVLVPVGIIIFIIPNLRSRIFTPTGLKINPWSKVGLLFMLGQTAGGISELLLTFSVSLANPALVNSLQGVQYVFLFIFSIVLTRFYPTIFKEKYTPIKIVGKILGILLIALGLYFLSFSSMHKSNVSLGVTYSPNYASSLGLDPKQTYISMLNDLQIKVIRFPVYWNQVEQTEGQFDFSKEDFYLQQAQDKNIDVILVVGQKQPRWPECYPPAWAVNLPQAQREAKTLNLVKAEVEHFKQFSAIKTWQVENEPFFDFGFCTPLTTDFFKQEVALVKSLDHRPTLITDTGELSNWYQSFPLTDKFGFSLYRSVWNPYLGMVQYPIPPIFYPLKAMTLNLLLSTHQTSLVSELQAEPWAPAKMHLADLSPEEQSQLFPADRLINNIKFAKETQQTEIYLWGVEWWYYMNSKGYPEYISTAQKLFSSGN